MLLLDQWLAITNLQGQMSVRLPIIPSLSLQVFIASSHIGYATDTTIAAAFLNSDDHGLVSTSSYHDGQITNPMAATVFSIGII